MLRSLSQIFDKAAQQGRQEDRSGCAADRAPGAGHVSADKQVQIACDHAKDATARLIGHEPPRFKNDEQNLDDLKARIAKTIDYVQSARAAGRRWMANLTVKMGQITISSDGNGRSRSWGSGSAPSQRS
jgi:uncharacterized protein